MPKVQCDSSPSPKRRYETLSQLVRLSLCLVETLQLLPGRRLYDGETYLACSSIELVTKLEPWSHYLYFFDAFGYLDLGFWRGRSESSPITVETTEISVTTTL